MEISSNLESEVTRTNISFVRKADTENCVLIFFSKSDRTARGNFRLRLGGGENSGIPS